jgi:DNA-binding NarL/FixJ family response regulator
MLSDPRAIDPNHGRINPRAAYLNKRRLANHEELLDALEAVLHDQDLSKFRHDLSDESPIAKMTTGQVQVLFMVARGFTNQQIADARKRSLSATEALIGRTFSALGVDPARDANARILAVREFFRQAGIVVPDVERP